jgi:hypothetical protein
VRARLAGLSALSGALGQREQIVRLNAICFCLDILVAVVSGDNHIHSPSGAMHEELFTSLNFGNTRRLSDLERTPEARTPPTF